MANSIFSLFGEIFVENGQANQAIDETDQRAEKTSGTFGKMGGAAKKLGGFLGGALVAGAGAALAGLGGLVKVGDDLQKSLNSLQTQTGASTEEMKGMEESLKNIYKNNFGESFEDIAHSMANVKQTTGLAGEELEAMTQNALMLRDTFEFEVEESTRAAESMMKQFGISSEQAMTLIAQGAQNGANKNGDLLDILNEYSPALSSIGLTAEDSMNMLINSSQNGAWSVDKIGDAVKEMNIKMKDGNDATIEALGELGLNAGQVTKAFGQGGEAGRKAFTEVMQALSSVEDPLLKNQLGVSIMGTMYEDLEAGAVDAMGNITGSANMTGDTLEQINAIKYNTFGEALQGVGRNLLMGVFEPFQQKVMPIVNEFSQWIADKMPVVESITNKTFSKIFEVAGIVWNFFKKNILPIFTEWSNNVKGNFPVIQSVVQTVFNAIWSVAKTVWSFFKSSILPIFASLYSWIQGHMPTIRKTVEVVFNKIREVAYMVWQFFKNNILPIIASLLSYVQSKMPLIQSIIEKVFSVIRNVVEIVWGVFKNLLLPILKALWDWISPHIPKVQKIVETAFDAIFWVVDKVVGVFEAVTGAVKKAIDWIGSWNKTDAKDKNVKVKTNYSNSGVAGGLPRNATGTNHFEGGATLVGERGPELVTLPKGAKIDPANETRNKLSGSNITQNITINSPKPLSASEIARKNLQASRLLAMEWGY
jgi:phage-related minor tail protein